MSINTQQSNSSSDLEGIAANTVQTPIVHFQSVEPDISERINIFSKLLISVTLLYLITPIIFSSIDPNAVDGNSSNFRGWLWIYIIPFNILIAVGILKRMKSALYSFRFVGFSGIALGIALSPIALPRLAAVIDGQGLIFYANVAEAIALVLIILVWLYGLTILCRKSVSILFK